MSLDWKEIHNLLLSERSQYSPTDKHGKKIREISLKENHNLWHRGIINGYSEKVPNRRKSKNKQLFTLLYDNWTSNDARNSDFVVGVLAPGKEAKSNWSHKRYDTGEYDCNHNDVLPVILLGHEVFDKPLTFEEIFDALAKLADVDKSTAFILRHILLRMAFCVDHKVLENGNVRWEPPLEIMQIIYEKIPEIKVNSINYPIEVFLHLVEVLAINEDSKAYTLGRDKFAGAGRPNTVMTLAHILCFILDDVSIGTLAGKFASQPSGLAPISMWQIWEMSPLFDSNFDISLISDYVNCIDKVPRNKKQNSEHLFYRSKRCYLRRNKGEMWLHQEEELEWKWDL